MRFYINDKEVNQESFDEAIKSESRAYAEDNYEAMLDKCHEPIKFGNDYYDFSYVLYKVSRTAFMDGLNEYINSLIDDANYELQLNNYVVVNKTKFRVNWRDYE